MEERLINGKNEKSFLENYCHNLSSVREIGLNWEDLVELYEEHKRNFLEFDSIAKNEFEKIKNIKCAYYAKYRVKDPEHVVDKAIRKKIDKDIVITKDNYIEYLDDLIGFRVLHLFKNEWEQIHAEISEKYKLKERPIAYYRKGDSKEYLTQCKSKGLRTKIKEAGYRSIHYVIKTSHLSNKLTCEIQARTIIEEAWSEIDHIVRYPNNTQDEIFNKYLLLFNALAGTADEMGTNLMFIKQSLNNERSSNIQQERELNTTISELKKEISSLQNIQETQKEKIESLIQRLERYKNIYGFNIPIIDTPSTFDLIDQVYNPSGITAANQIMEMNDSILENLKAKYPKFTFDYFMMPKIGEPLPFLEDFPLPPGKKTGKNKKK